MSKEVDDLLKAIKKRERERRITSTADMRVTASQDREIQHIIRNVMRYDGLERPKTHEFKRFEIRQYSGSKKLYVTTEIGLKKDEGTYNALLTRTTREFEVGPRGKLCLLNPRLKAGEEYGRKVCGHRAYTAATD